MNSNKKDCVQEIINNYLGNLNRIVATLPGSSKKAAETAFFWSQLDLVLNLSNLGNNCVIFYYEQWCTDWECYSIDPVCTVFNNDCDTDLLKDFLNYILNENIFVERSFNDSAIVSLKFTIDVKNKSVSQISMCTDLNAWDSDPIAALLVNIQTDPAKLDTFTALLDLVDYDLSKKEDLELVEQLVKKLYPGCTTRKIYYSEQHYGCWIPKLKNLELPLTKREPDALIKQRFEQLAEFEYQLERTIF